ncbi:MAG TPA: hypothetical protein VM032_05380 [Vicinamibacterales bacterium]|nr:hypothetical protein [Vicinamibacterales bacterium]
MKLQFDFVCPEGHQFSVAFDRDELKQSLDKPFGHGISCVDCGRDYQPSREWIEQAKERVRLSEAGDGA